MRGVIKSNFSVVVSLWETFLVCLFVVCRYLLQYHACDLVDRGLNHLPEFNTDETEELPIFLPRTAAPAAEGKKSRKRT